MTYLRTGFDLRVEEWLPPGPGCGGSWWWRSEADGVGVRRGTVSAGGGDAAGAARRCLRISLTGDRRRSRGRRCGHETLIGEAGSGDRSRSVGLRRGADASRHAVCWSRRGAVDRRFMPGVADRARGACRKRSCGPGRHVRAVTLTSDRGSRRHLAARGMAWLHVARGDHAPPPDRSSSPASEETRTLDQLRADVR